MASITESPSTSDGARRISLKRAGACHQCRKRKMKCDAQRPCSNCRRTYNKMIRINPHLSHTEPNCTYDQSLEAPSELENDENSTSVLDLSKMEQRIEGLEMLLNAKGHSTSGASNGPAVPGDLNLGVEAEPLTPTPPCSDNSPSFMASPSPLPVTIDEWPLALPPRSLMLHLIDLFFTCYPNSRRIIHRPTFLLQMMEHPSSPRFPFIPLLHSICAAAAMHSHLVAVPPAPDLRNRPAEDIFQEKTRMQQGRGLMFDEQHYLLSKYECMAAAREGRDLLSVIQAAIINGWWAFSCARWFDLWTSNSLAMRLCVALGLNLADSLQDPLSEKTREKLLVGAPLSHTDVELRRNIFWLSYCLERYHIVPSTWAFDVSDEDIHQTIPGTLEAFEAGYDDGQVRQNIHSADLFMTHRSNMDDFGMYVKSAIMLSRLHTAQHRRQGLAQYETAEEVHNSQELRILEEMVTSMRSSVLKMQLNPTDQSSTSAISNSYMAHMTPLWASIKLHIYLANWSDPTCESANKTLAAARSIIRYITVLASTSWDCARLDRVACMCWGSAGRALLLSLQHAPNSLVPILQAEIRLVRNSYLIAGDRIPFYLRQRRAFDLEIVDILGEREAAKIFAEDAL